MSRENLSVIILAFSVSWRFIPSIFFTNDLGLLYTLELTKIEVIVIF